VPGAYVYHGERVRVQVLPLLREGLQSRVLEGSLAPKGGWVSYGYAVKVPAPQLIYTQSGPAPTRFLTALIREGQGDVQREDGQDGGSIALGIESGDKAWRVTLGGEAQQWTVGWETTSRV
jgi:hypothetical protein